MSKKIIVLIYSLLVTAAALSQWQSDIRLTNNTAESYTPYNNGRCISAAGDIIHVVWFDDRDGNFEIYYKRSPDGGLSWGQDTRLTNNSGSSQFSSVAVAGSLVNLVWDDDRDGNREIYYKRSTDAGVSWSSDIRLTNNSAVSKVPCIVVNGIEIYVAWDDDRNGNFEIYYKRSPDGGLSWSADTRLTNNSAVSRFASLFVTAATLHLVWEDDRDGNREVYYNRSSDGGQTWGSDTRLTFDAAISANPTISVSGSVIHVFWHDNRNGNMDIYYKRSPDGGTSWSQDTRFTVNPSSSFFATATASGTYIHLTWMDNRDGNNEIYYNFSANNGLNWNADARLTNNSAESAGSHIAFSGSVLHVVWNDNRDGNYEMYYKRNPTGNPVGVISTTNGIPDDFSLSQNYPNPFNPSTKIRFALPKTSFVRILIFDNLGRVIETILDKELNAGHYEVQWNSSNFTSGVYYYKMITKEFSGSNKMVLIK
jgi:hypothetical protein